MHTCQPDKGDARDVFQSEKLFGNIVGWGEAHDQLVPVHGDHAEGEGGGEAEHQWEKGGDIAEDRGVGENPAI